MASEVSLAAEKVFHLGPLPITNSLLATWAVMVILIVGAFILNKKIQKEKPGGFQNLVEMIFEGALNLMDSVTQDRQQSLKFFPFVFTLFILIILGNWFGLMPGVGTVGFHEIHEGKELFVPLLRGSAADLNFTLALAAISVVATQVIAIFTLGTWKHLKKYINFKNPILGFVGALEGISEFAKILSFSFRLFGNIFAGEVLLIVIGLIIPYLVPIPFLFLELFVGFIQAFIFSVLTLVFLKIATTASEH
ncbi:ATP synthase F0 subunit A [Candidatus Parcubacteria bacterium]|jgi:F-type H+-transporting ATPase subunit a|nr:MAG: ATP synthase F0 subunit A [Candidatus Parcubacteria bacterium]